MDDKELRSIAEKYAEQVAKMASEAGQVLDRTMAAMDASARQAYEEITRGSRPHTEEMKKLAKDIVGEIKNDIPRMRSELKELESKARQKLRDLQGK
jgi:gas vesicle protein